MKSSNHRSLKEAYEANELMKLNEAIKTIRENVLTFETSNPEQLESLAESISELEDMSGMLTKLNVTALSNYLKAAKVALIEAVMNLKNPQAFEEELYRYSALSEFLKSKQLSSLLNEKESKLTAESLLSVCRDSKSFSLLSEKGVSDVVELVEGLSKQATKQQMKALAEHAPTVPVIISTTTATKLASEMVLLEQEQDQLMQQAQQAVKLLTQLNNSLSKLPDEFKETKDGIKNFASRFAENIGADPKELAPLTAYANLILAFFNKFRDWPKLAPAFENMAGNPKAFEENFRKFFISPVEASVKTGWFGKLASWWKGTTIPKWPAEFDPDVFMKDVQEVLNKPASEEENVSERLNEDFAALSSALGALGGRISATSAKKPAAMKQQQQQPGAAPAQPADSAQVNKPAAPNTQAMMQSVDKLIGSLQTILSSSDTGKDPQGTKQVRELMNALIQLKEKLSGGSNSSAPSTPSSGVVMPPPPPGGGTPLGAPPPPANWNPLAKTVTEEALKIVNQLLLLNN